MLFVSNAVCIDFMVIVKLESSAVILVNWCNQRDYMKQMQCLFHQLKSESLMLNSDTF